MYRTSRLAAMSLIGCLFAVPSIAVAQTNTADQSALATACKYPPTGTATPENASADAGMPKDKKGTSGWQGGGGGYQKGAEVKPDSEKQSNVAAGLDLKGGGPKTEPPGC
jgi:hypothetical protein